LFFEVPKDYSNPSLGTLRLFARSVSRHEKPAAPVSNEDSAKTSQKPWFVYLQGGPGFGCRPPQDFPATQPVLDKGYQLLYLDQRGTGLSSPISSATLALQGDAQRQADYLKHFRADSIVKDCEAIRNTLTADYPEDLKKWTICGQSFGGFCGITYLSQAYKGLREVFMLGGLAPVGKTADEVYKATFARVIKRNKAYYDKYPEDVDTIHNLASYIESQGGLKLPGGGNLTVRRFLCIGIAFGTHGGIDSVHVLVLRMRSDLEQFSFITRATLSSLESMGGLDDNVIYAILHEAIYCEGTASNWAAERVGRSLREFQWLSGNPGSSSEVRKYPLFFSGEMIFPFMFDVYPELERIKDAAEILAKYTEWPRLYDEWQLARNKVPVYSAAYMEDMYVDFGLAQETANKIQGCKQFITNVMYHDAVRSKTDQVLEELFKLRDDTID
jgi:pimeloyl-ACP methyl ester carboxylesterase